MSRSTRQPERGTQQAVQSCPYESQEQGGRTLQLMKHKYLHEDGRKLITTWFKQAWDRKHDDSATFESFIFTWISVNAWAACVTGQDADTAYLRELKSDSGLREKYQHLLKSDQQFQHDSDSFIGLLPIFKAQDLRRRGVRPPKTVSTRREIVQHYFDEQHIPYAPKCAEWHLARDGHLPNDWPHVISAIYRVRCNLFHGEKAAHSEMDKEIVRAAFLTLIGFFRGAEIL